MCIIRSGVGAGGSNHSEDVRIVQELLGWNANFLGLFGAPPPQTGQVDSATLNALQSWQTHLAGSAGRWGATGFLSRPAVLPGSDSLLQLCQGALGGPFGFLGAKDRNLAQQAASITGQVSYYGFRLVVQSRRRRRSDKEIEALNLSEVAKKAAYELKAKCPSVRFTSGRRDKQEQAHAMATNAALNRSWIKETYVQSAARDACQKWVDDNKNKNTVNEIAVGLKAVLDGLSDAQLAQLSKHLSGDAFDVQPVDNGADQIKKAIRGLAGLGLFLEKEGGLVRWHAQF